MDFLSFWCSRHFVKEQLPRIRYANPTLDIQVEKARKAANEVWRPEMEIEFSEQRASYILISN
jgi:small subunit ribosomal protein S25